MSDQTIEHPETAQSDVETDAQITSTSFPEESSQENLFPDQSVRGRDSAADIERILDIPVQLSVEIGRTRTTINNVLQLSPGSVVELDAKAGSPMDVLINGYLIAQGEVVVVNDRFGIRLTDIVTPSERMRRLNRS